MANDHSEKLCLTDGEMRILKAIFANMNSKPDVDWDTAASQASLGNAKSIKERYRQMCNRLGWNKKKDGGAGSAPVSPEKVESPAKVVKRGGGGSRRATKKKTPPTVKREEEEEEEETDRGRVTGGRAAVATADEDDEDKGEF